jgi:uncharacterized membrane protein YqiK
MSSPLFVVLTAIGIIVLLIFGIFSLFAKFYRKVEQGYAMIVNTTNDTPHVTFTGRMVYPIIHKVEMMDISLKTIEISRTGNEGLICQDNIRADIKVTFFMRIEKKDENVLSVAQNVGCARASNQKTLEELFSAKFSEALKTVGKSMDFTELYQARDRFRDEILRQIGGNLAGYTLEDAAIDYLEQTPISKLDKNNILDAQGIKKITEVTAQANIRTNEAERDEQRQIKKKDVETSEAILELERQQAEAESKQKREIETVRARESAETQRVQAEEHARSKLAELQAEQTIAVQQENVIREKEVAENNRKRAVAIEEERVTRARQLEIVDREKEVTLQQIARDHAVEVQKKSIADVIRERIIVERTVAEQEEAIKEVRVVAEADRIKKVTIITAEGEAEEKLILNVKEAQSQEQRAHFKAAEEVTFAEAKLKVAEKAAEAKKREAEGTEATTAAPGLAQAKVMMVTAEAREKQGLVEAKVKIASAEAVEKLGLADASALQAQLVAEAEGKEKQGLAEANVLQAKYQAEAEGKEKQGLAEANVLQAKYLAEAEGKEKQGLAEARAKIAAAEAVEKLGQAEANALQAQLVAEAEGKERQGLAEANALQAKYLAEAEGKEKQGLAEARAKHAAAGAVEKYGLAEANALQAQLLAEAEGKEKQGMAEVNVRTASAEAIANVGEAEGKAIEARVAAEAKGLREKFEAMKAMSDETRAHEEFRMKLERAHVENLKAIGIQADIARDQAEVLAAALTKANIDIVGGEGDYFERFMKALTIGKSIDGIFGKSEALKAGLRDQLDGKRNIVDDAQGLIGAISDASGGVQNLSIAGLLAKLAKDGSPDLKAALQALLDGGKKG